MNRGDSHANIEVIQQPFVLPLGYQKVETSSFIIAIPEKWSFKTGAASDSLVFQLEGQEVGQTEVLGWFNKATWPEMKPNHSKQTSFNEIEGIVSTGETDMKTYSIQLIHTKPAAAQNSDWTYEESRWYVTVKEQGCSYGLYFSSHDVSEATMKTIFSTFRLNDLK
jgi:hypothetical protein